MNLNLARTLARSAANGPGERYVIWTQGCPHRCRGCWNPDTWTAGRRDLRDHQTLIDEIRHTAGIEGLTFTGGEPFVQARALATIGFAAQQAGLSVFVFTGYELEELRSKAHLALLAVTDVLVTGRFVQAMRTFVLPWRGSTNQQVHFLTTRYGQADMLEAPEVELHIGPDGAITVTGFPAEDLWCSAG